MVPQTSGHTKLDATSSCRHVIGVKQNIHQHQSTIDPRRVNLLRPGYLPQTFTMEIPEYSILTSDFQRIDSVEDEAEVSPEISVVDGEWDCLGGELGSGVEGELVVSVSRDVESGPNISICDIASQVSRLFPNTFMMCIGVSGYDLLFCLADRTNTHSTVGQITFFPAEAINILSFARRDQSKGYQKTSRKGR